MSAFSWLATAIYYALLVFVFVMWGRLIADFGRALRPGWRPQGVVLVVLNLVYAITDPPIRLVRRVVKPIRFGNIALDFAWTVVLLIAIIAMYATLAFA